MLDLYLYLVANGTRSNIDSAVFICTAVRISVSSFCLRLRKYTCLRKIIPFFTLPALRCIISGRVNWVVFSSVERWSTILRNVIGRFNAGCHSLKVISSLNGASHVIFYLNVMILLFFFNIVKGTALKAVWIGKSTTLIVKLSLILFHLFLSYIIISYLNIIQEEQN